MRRPEDSKVVVVGLGYVGLPLAVEFAKKVDVVGYDINQRRVDALRAGTDHTLEVSDEELRAATRLSFTADPADIADADVYIVTTPTPIDEAKRPDLRPLLSASEAIGKVLNPGDVVIYESTVYPGATEEDCVPVLEKFSGLTVNQDFYVGYSPERINPGDKEHRVHSIVKVTSGSTPDAADFVDDLYGLIITAGTHKAPSIKVAEAAKVIENTQRDVNIALVNELAMLFNRMGINTREVLDAASTKWNFLHFTPGLVGGHCIGVDPYYLTHKAQMMGYHPEIILAGRRINDSMGGYVASQMVKRLAQEGISIKNSRVLVMGLAFKENTPDLRNTRVIDVIHELRDFGVQVDVHDPWVDADEARSVYGIELVPLRSATSYDGILFAVPHLQFKETGALFVKELRERQLCVVYDLKNIFTEGDKLSL